MQKILLVLLSGVFTCALAHAKPPGQYESVVDQIRERSLVRWEHQDDLDLENMIEVREEFSRVSDADLATIKEINALARNEQYKFSTAWIADLLTPVAYTETYGTHKFVFNYLDGLIIQLAKRDPHRFLSIPGLFEETYSYPQFPDYLRYHVVKLVVGALRTSNLTNEERVQRLLTLVEQTGLYIKIEDGRDDYRIFQSIAESLTRNHINNKDSARVYAKIMTQYRGTVPSFNDIKEGKSHRSLFRIYQAMEDKRFKPEWMERIFAIANQDPQQHMDAKNWLGILFGGEPGALPPSQRTNYLQDLTDFINSEYSRTNQCNKWMRFQVRINQLLNR